MGLIDKYIQTWKTLQKAKLTKEGDVRFLLPKYMRKHGSLFEDDGITIRNDVLARAFLLKDNGHF
jgi:hypothetical protein